MDAPAAAVRRRLATPPRVDPRDVDFSAIRAQGAGGQNVNKVSNAAHLRFDIGASRLPDDVKQRLLALADQRVSADGVVVIKAQDHRSLPLNQAAALARLQEMVDRVSAPAVPRRPTKPTLASRRRRLEAKGQRAEVKAGRGRVEP
jgi:ribosome-associated protein